MLWRLGRWREYQKLISRVATVLRINFFLLIKHLMSLPLHAHPLPSFLQLLSSRLLTNKDRAKDFQFVYRAMVSFH